MGMLDLPARVIRGGGDGGRPGHRESVELPIGVFDSGVGGITALRALAHRWPGETFLYLADTARLPYGAKSPETIEQYLVQNMKFLLQKGVKAIVVACNSASTVLLEEDSSTGSRSQCDQPRLRTSRFPHRTNRIGKASWEREPQS